MKGRGFEKVAVERYLRFLSPQQRQRLEQEAIARADPILGSLYLSPLAAVVDVTILMIPPDGGGKDLDNLATRIVRHLHESWAPPSNLAHAYNSDRIENESVRAQWENARNEIPKALKYSIAEYHVFELPRLPDGPKEGFVQLAAGDGIRPVRFREDIDEYLEKWENAVDR